MFKPKTVRRRALALCTSLTVVMGFGLAAATHAAAFAPSGIENFNPNWDSTLTDADGPEPSILVLSDKFDGAPTLEQRTGDILAVLDAAGLDRPALVGVSEGGLMAQLGHACRPAPIGGAGQTHAVKYPPAAAPV